MMKNNLAQWEKRLIVVKYIYSQLIKNEPVDIAKNNFSKYFLDVDAQFVETLEFCLDHKNEIINVISTALLDNWTFDRLNLVDQAILLEAYSECKILRTDKNIMIDQSIITSKKYSDANSYEFINAILDKIL